MNCVILVAAGSGERLAAGGPKALVDVAGAPLIIWSLRAIGACPDVGAVVVAAPPGHADAVLAAIPAEMRDRTTVVEGGSSRQRSVAAALDAVPQTAVAIAVHDAARPLVRAAMFSRVLAALDQAPGAILATRLADTLKRASPHTTVLQTVDRTDLWCAQTPQAFRADQLRKVFATADAAELDHATDCSSMAEQRGLVIALVDAGEPNLKVTTKADLAVVEAVLRARAGAG